MNGAELSRAFHVEVVAPLLAVHVPRLRVAAGRLGTGSDVLGYDDAVSRDHDWGLRLTLLTDDPAPELPPLLDAHLPDSFAGHPVRFAYSDDPRVRHRVDVATVASLATRHLGVDATRSLLPDEWLSLTGQAVLEVLAGPVFADATRTFGPLRARLAWYPDDVWRHVLAAGWMRVDERLPFVGRTGERGDDLGSRLLAAGLVADVVALAFLVSRTWAPYEKWRGTALARLPIAHRLDGLTAALDARSWGMEGPTEEARGGSSWGMEGPTEEARGGSSRGMEGPTEEARGGSSRGMEGPTEEARGGSSWRSREAGLCSALDAVLDVQRAAGLPGPARATVPFHARPFRTVDPAVAAALRADIRDPAVLALPPDVGAPEQWIDHVPLLADAARRRAVTAPGGGGPVR